MKFPNAVVWIDHDEAHIIHFDADSSEELTLKAKHRRGHLHHRAGHSGDGREPEDHAFHRAVEESLADVGEILIVGPASERLELEKHMSLHASPIYERLIGVQPADHPTSGEVLSLARKYFRAADRLGRIA